MDLKAIKDQLLNEATGLAANIKSLETTIAELKEEVKKQNNKLYAKIGQSQLIDQLAPIINNEIDKAVKEAATKSDQPIGNRKENKDGHSKRASSK